MTAPTLDLEYVAPEWVDNALARRWWKFHVANPEVGCALADLSLALVRRGHRHFGIALVWERLRYETLIGARDTHGAPRLNNDFRAYYARWLMEAHPLLDGVFVTRETRASRIEGEDQ